MNKYEIKGKTTLATAQDSKVMEIALKHGIIMPSEDLAIFVTKYAALEEANLNGVRLATDAVQKFLASINGKLADIDHIRPYVIGSILEGWINADTKEIEIAFTMYKSVFIEEYAQALEKLHAGDLAVSFELTTNPDTIETLPDNTIRLHDINFSGVGLLLNTNPAYPKAKVFEMANRLLNKVKDTNMVFASQIAEELGSNVISEIEKVEEVQNLQEGGQSIMEFTEEQKALIAKRKVDLGEKGKDWKDEDFLNEAKLVEAGYVVEMKHDCTQTQEVNDDGTAKVTTTDNSVQTVTQDDGTKDIRTETNQNVVTYTQAQLDEQVKKASDTQAELDALKAEHAIALNRIKELEDTEAARQAAIVKAEADAKLAAIKDGLKDNPYVKEFSDEDYLNTEKVEKAQLQKENDDLKAKLAEKSTATQEVVAAAETTVLVTGHEETPSEVIKEEPISKLINKLGKD